MPASKPKGARPRFNALPLASTATGRPAAAAAGPPPSALARATSPIGIAGAAAAPASEAEDRAQASAVSRVADGRATTAAGTATTAGSVIADATELAEKLQAQRIVLQQKLSQHTSRRSQSTGTPGQAPRASLSRSESLARTGATTVLTGLGLQTQATAVPPAKDALEALAPSPATPAAPPAQGASGVSTDIIGSTWMGAQDAREQAKKNKRRRRKHGHDTEKRPLERPSVARSARRTAVEAEVPMRASASLASGSSASASGSSSPVLEPAVGDKAAQVDVPSILTTEARKQFEMGAASQVAATQTPPSRSQVLHAAELMLSPALLPPPSIAAASPPMSVPVESVQESLLTMPSYHTEPTQRMTQRATQRTAPRVTVESPVEPAGRFFPTSAAAASMHDGGRVRRPNALYGSAALYLGDDSGDGELGDVALQSFGTRTLVQDQRSSAADGGSSADLANRLAVVERALLHVGPLNMICAGDRATELMRACCISHPGSVRSLAFSPSAMRLAVCLADRVVLWELDERVTCWRALAELEVLESGEFFKACFTETGRELIVAGWFAVPRSTCVPGVAGSAELSGRAAGLVYGGGFRVYAVPQLAVRVQHVQALPMLTRAPGGLLPKTGTEERRACARQLELCEIRQLLVVSPIEVLCSSVGGGVSSVRFDLSVRRVASAKQLPVEHVNGEPALCLGLCLVRAASQLVVGSFAGFAVAWDLRAGTLLWRASVQARQFNPKTDESTSFASGETRVRFADAVSNEPAQHAPAGDGAPGMLMGYCVCAPSAVERLDCDPAVLAELAQLRADATNSAIGLTFFDGKCDSQAVLALQWPGMVDERAAGGTQSSNGAGGCAGEAGSEFDVDGSGMRFVCCQATNERYLAVGFASGELVIWNKHTCEPVCYVHSHSVAMTAVTMHPSAPFLATASLDGCVHVYSTSALVCVDLNRPSDDDADMYSCETSGGLGEDGGGGEESEGAGGGGGGDDDDADVHR